MAEWDAGIVMAAPQGLEMPQDTVPGLKPETIRRLARDFIRSFTQANVHIYRNQVLQNFNVHLAYVEIDMQHIHEWSEQLHDELLKKPNDVLEMIEAGVRDALLTFLGSDVTDAGDPIPSIQVLLIGDLHPTPLRDITATQMNRLVAVPGIVINSSRTRPKATQVTLRCKNCAQERVLTVPSGFGGLVLPKHCNTLAETAENGGNPPPGTQKCPTDPFVIITDKSKFVDQQSLKLQEAPEMVPTGEMPRHITLEVERQLADKISPGTRVTLLGIVSVFNRMGGAGGRRGGRGDSSVRVPYLRVVGVMVQENGAGRSSTSFTMEEEEQFRALARDPHLFNRLAHSVAPSISGDYTTDIKKAILCLLMAGSRKVLPDGMRLRGDINVLMLGDPSTAKSQFLKFVEKVAPVGVYTSGKGSSAAGLTASVIRDARGEFYLEGGAMVLADGGVVCIDEFDKMREEDRVAIHEAMEQQTISVAKAGITTILNSRAAVLAAANPVFGRYDDTKSAADNIDLLPTILSRFDLIFIVRDVRHERRDQEIARHVMRVHINAETGGLDEAAGEIDMSLMKKYITYARARCAPRLTEETARFLQAKYVEIRQEARGRESDARSAQLADTEEHGVIPITVRQLEALIRITESVAKACLAREANIVHAQEALRLFRVSTLNAAASGLTTLEAYMTDAMLAAVRNVERRMAMLIPIGGSAPTSRVKESLFRAGFDENSVNTALRVMERRDDVTLINERKTIRRNK